MKFLGKRQKIVQYNHVQYNPKRVIKHHLRWCLTKVLWMYCLWMYCSYFCLFLNNSSTHHQNTPSSYTLLLVLVLGSLHPWFRSSRRRRRWFIHGFSSSMVLFIFFVRDAQTKMARDEWVRAAMTDDAVVVELLVGLK